MEYLARRKPKCLSKTNTVKGKCDGTFSIGEICDEYGTTGKCCTSDCQLKSGAVCSPVSDEDFREKENLSLFFSRLVHVVKIHVNIILWIINVVMKLNVNSQ